MHKKVARDAVPEQLFFMEKMQSSNNALNAYCANGYLFGNPKSTAYFGFSIGSNYGWLKTILLDNCAKYLDAALLRSPKSRITGSTKSRKSGMISPRSNI
jgi:hypothetical protein